MGIIEDIKSTVMSWINSAKYSVQSYAYDLYSSVWNYASQISNDLWHETNLIWDQIGKIPVLTYDVIIDWVSPLIDGAKTYSLNLVNNVIATFDPIISALDNAVDHLKEWKEDVVDVKLYEFSTWITNSDEWFETKFNTFQEKVIDWVIDKFEYILDRIFTEVE